MVSSYKGGRPIRTSMAKIPLATMHTCLFDTTKSTWPEFGLKQLLREICAAAARAIIGVARCKNLLGQLDRWLRR